MRAGLLACEGLKRHSRTLAHSAVIPLGRGSPPFVDFDALSNDLTASDWCEIYVRGAEDVCVLVPIVASAVGGQPRGTSITAPEGIEIDVGTNATNPKFERVRPEETDFVFWPFIIDLEVDEERGVPLVGAILRELWSRDLWAVAACSFEEKLPRSGGYRDGQLNLTDE